jgi:hypothetical protein
MKFVIVFVVCFACMAGCGGSSPVVPVEGAVTLDGKPLADAAIAFSPAKATAPGPYMATTDAQGHYALGFHDDPGGGAAPGEYTVIITTVKPTGGMEDSPAPTEKEVVPPIYRDGRTRFTVPPEGTTTANFDISSK